LIETNSERFQKALLHADGFNSYVRVFLNDHLVAGEGFETAIADGDEILLFPAIAGGGVVTTVVGLQRRKGSG
jgi:molybdopterin converting factor small subunit